MIRRFAVQSSTPRQLLQHRSVQNQQLDRNRTGPTALDLGTIAGRASGFYRKPYSGVGEYNTFGK